MDILPKNKVQVDEEVQAKEVRDDDELVHESLFRYHNQHSDSEHSQCVNQKSPDAHPFKWQYLASATRLMMQEGFGLPSSSPKRSAKRRKTENILEVSGGGGGRIIQAAGRKDRHSKVSTARGTRDRRLRLAPKTAIQFYDVQDRLGYDRPSKAIDWLMKEAKAAIDALDNHSPPPPGAVAIPNGNFLKSENESGVVSNLGFFTNDDGNSSVRRTYECPEDLSGIYHDNYRQDGILSAPLTSSWEVFDWNPELCRMQMFTQREPLQSSISRIAANYSPIISAQFPGICYSNEEIPSFSAPAMLKVEEMDEIVSGKPFSAA